MTKVKIRILKWIAATLIITLAFYTLVWASIVISITNSLNNSYAGKNFNISEQAKIKFAKANAKGFPFDFAIELNEFTEENNTTIIRHFSPILVGYNILSQEFYLHYKGESVARYKPEESGFGSKVIGEYKISAYIPIDISLLKTMASTKSPFELVNYINDFNMASKNVRVYDLTDNSVTIGDASMNFKLSVKHHKHYTSLSELLSSIPKDYSVKLFAESKDTGSFKTAIPFSIVYWAYLPMNFQYNFDVDIHTEAKEFEFEEILNNITIKANHLGFSNNIQSSVSELSVSHNNDFIKDKFDVKYLSAIKLKSDFASHIENLVQMVAESIPSDNPLVFMKPILKELKISKINLDTKDKDITLFADVSSVASDKTNIELDLKNLSLNFDNTGVSLKALINNNFNGEWFKGVVEIVEWRRAIKYLTDSYFAMRNVDYHDVLTNQFWSNLYIDFLESIANDVNVETSNLTIKMDIVKDFPASQIGKFSWAEVYLLYYAKLFQHVLAASKSRDEALHLFRIIIPSQISDQKIFEKVTQAK